ncbi:unnamed protein product [Penicillium salamii]|uniref:Protein arginine N-methyltransferase n=1 Tax=Penicillium salamii TaxID=1612424 RepID=A0A9W4IG05_9EURO|nr:unnamed protein product [Penicillium salamii]CAG8254379.1 unnamed protein product [Penicillium salamii]CAG8278022.1 unnamed protein product [Penicillium salamii]CAG8296638.1 unnamed protein product [Penicillium salamii]CAG8389629.1 unnamed protein product [Penicillium salamii]
MENYNPSEDPGPTFCVGHHEHNRLVTVTPRVIQNVHESNYDMMTVPITTAHFHSRVLGLLSSYLTNLQPPTYDAVGTRATTANTRPLVVPSLSKADSYLTPNDATSQLVGVTSSWIDLCSPDPLIADLSRQVLMLEVAYAAFCGIGYLLIPGPKLHHGALHSEGVIYYARAVQDALNLGPYIQFHIWLQMVDNPETEVDTMGDLAPLARADFLEPGDGTPLEVDLFGTWDAWDAIRKTCKYHTRLFVALSMPKQLPSLFVQSRWHSEPVHLLTIDGSAFLKNQKGYPVLSKSHQALIAKMMRLRTAPWILLCGVGPIPGLENSEDPDSNQAGSDYPSLSQVSKKHHDPTPHLSYIRNLQQRQPSRTAIERFGTGYQDYLQAPLQPLTVNLESITYEVFEKDPIKYEWYEKAIYKALKDWADQKKPTSHPDGKVILAVVGAGRGPLVTRALKASAEAGVEIDMWAVEKNPNAFVLLQRHNETIWDGKVTLVQSDMRAWKGPRVRKQATPGAKESVGESLGIEESLLLKKGENDQGHASAFAQSHDADLCYTHADIIVSELLGSFADNELSPECLDGVNDLINPVHGISIPASYSAHFTPVSAPKLHSDIVHQTVSNPAAPETPYVVMLHAIDFLSTASTQATNETPNPSDGTRSSTSGSFSATEFPTPFVQTAWSFSHPNRHIPAQSPMQSTISNAHNVRQTRLTFPAQNRGACHGLAGYFETVLYGDVELSTNPVTMDAKSASMISWFPIYFPLKTPLNVPENGEIVATMYRQTDDRKVWYEWMVEVYALERTSSSSKSIPNGGSRTGSPSQENLKTKANAATPSRAGYRRVRVGISDLHSSIKDGCLM